MLFNEKLRYLRKINNMSQEELAGKLTVSRQAVSRWETGDTMPDAETLLQLSEVFGVSIDNLLKDDLDIDDNTTVPVNDDEKNRLYVVSGIILTSLSSIGLLCLGVLSSLFPVYTKYLINGGADELYKATIFTFLAEHNLTWLFGFVIVVFLIGIALIFINKIKNVRILKCMKKYRRRDL